MGRVEVEAVERTTPPTDVRQENEEDTETPTPLYYFLRFLLLPSPSPPSPDELAVQVLSLSMAATSGHGALYEYNATKLLDATFEPRFRMYVVKDANKRSAAEEGNSVAVVVAVPAALLASLAICALVARGKEERGHRMAAVEAG